MREFVILCAHPLDPTWEQSPPNPGSLAPMIGQPLLSLPPLIGIYNYKALVLILAAFGNTRLQREWISLMQVCVPSGPTSRRNYLENKVMKFH